MIALTFFLTFVIFCVYYATKRNGSSFLPPGPRGLPLVGNLLQLAGGAPLHLKFREWANVYGKLYTIYFGSKPVIVVNDADVMKDILGLMEATGRMNSEVMDMISWSGMYGILMAEGKEWLEQKQFCVRSLRQFGFGRQGQTEPMIIAEAGKLCRWIDNENGKNGVGMLLVNEPILQCTGSVMWAIITGMASTGDQLQTPRIAYLIEKWIDALTPTFKSGLLVFPWIKYIAPVGSGYQELKSICEEIREYVENHFQKHGQTRISGEPPRDMIDAYIEKVEQCHDKNSTFYGESGWKHSYASVLMLMTASVDSTGQTLTWLIFYLSTHLQVQREVQREIDSVIGRNRNPEFGDKDSMPYLEAVILETLRYSSLAPTGGFVTLLEKVSFYDYELPKGSIVAPNLYYVHNDESIWGDPENFRPARFLERDNTLKAFVLAFQVGKRACIGEKFAKDALFLFAAKLFQKYTFSVDSSSVENAKEYMEPICGFSLKPKNLGVVVTERD